MSMEETKQIFNISDIPGFIELKKIYIFSVLFHPDGHLENSKVYEQKMNGGWKL